MLKNIIYIYLIALQNVCSNVIQFSLNIISILNKISYILKIR